ncbi:glycosyltransferase [Haladaptatus sp. ZSTT2]|uniref:glycosyltransferase n=1 Tax=Haladaptatus sp. ZSTT2 TaxID=3120515 RepID=UPI00300E7C56
MTETPIESESLRVLWLTPDKPANISVGRKRIADYLQTQGIEVVLRGTTLQTVRQSLRERREFDVIVGTTRAGAIAGTLLSVLGSKPLLVDHIDPIRQFAETHPRLLSVVVRVLENASFALADHVIYVYDEEAARVRKYASVATKTELGVPYDTFANPPQSVIERAETRLKRSGVNEHVVIYVGGLEPIYHIRELLDSMDYLPDWSLVILGTGSLEELVASKAAERENVIYLGTVPHEDVPGYLHAADVGVSLVDDAHTLKVLEYGSAGLPVVQLRGRAEGRFAGLASFCTLEPQAIATAIRSAPETTDTNALKETSKQYDWRSIGQVYESALRSTVNDHQ